MRDENLKNQLIHHEGVHLKPYRCSEKKLTIGIGHNLDDKPITRRAAMTIFEDDLADARYDVEAILDHYGISRWRLNAARQDALTNVAFNVGRRSLLGFRRMWAAVKVGNWICAADELLDSRYAREVGHRAVELAEQLRTGVYRG